MKRQTKVHRCWHCAGLGLCSCIACWDEVTASAGLCQACAGAAHWNAFRVWLDERAIDIREGRNWLHVKPDPPAFAHRVFLPELIFEMKSWAEKPNGPQSRMEAVVQSKDA